MDRPGRAGRDHQLDRRQLMKACPADPAHTTFVTTGVEYHDWLVDGNGHFIDDLGGFESRLGDGEYQCSSCQTPAIEADPTQPKDLP